MSNIFSFLLRHKLLFIFTTLLLMSGIVSSFIPQRVQEETQTQPAPTIIPLNPSTFPGRIFEERKAIIGQTTEAELRNMPELQKEVMSEDGGKIFDFTSSLILRSNSVSTNQTGTAVFERIVIPNSPPTSSLSEIKSELGEEEDIINGSSFYGAEINTYIYASRGIAILANPRNNEIYEVQFFQPMNSSDYVARYADAPQSFVEE